MKSLHAKNDVSLSLAILVLAALFAISIAPVHRAHAAPNFQYFQSSPRYGNHAGSCCYTVSAHMNSGVLSYDQQGFQDGAAAWNNSPAYIGFAVLTNSSCCPVELYDYYSTSDGMDGFSTKAQNGSIMLNSASDLNYAHTSGYNRATIQAIATHEMGHAVGLNHENTGMKPDGSPACGSGGAYPPYPAIMYFSARAAYAYCGVNKPTNDDNTGMDGLY